MANCYEYSDKVIKTASEIRKILRQKKKEPWQEEFNWRKQFKVRKALCEAVISLRELNDYEAAGLVYEGVMASIENYLLFMRAYIQKKGVYKYPKEERLYVCGRNEIEPKMREVQCKDDMYQPKLAEYAMEKADMCKIREASGRYVEHTRLSYLMKMREVLMSIAGKYFIHYNIQYLEIEKDKKAYPTREKVLAGYIWWANQMLLKKFNLSMPDAYKVNDIKPREIIFSTMPSSGKSFVNNTVNEMFSCLSREITGRGGVLRIGNEQGNISRQSRMTMGLITNNRIMDIYRELKQYIKTTGKFDPMGKSSEEEWNIEGALNQPNMTIFKTRDSAINSIRCELGIFDDPSRGQQESNNVKVHEEICSLFNGDFMDRFDSPNDQSVLLTGTMYNPFDVFSTEIQKALSDGFTRDKRFEPTAIYISDDKETIVILNDCEDEFGYSRFPDFISDKDLKKKKEGLSEYDYACIWRQKPIPAEGLIFSKEYLSFYDELPDDLTDYGYATIDPTRRKAKDFFSMPIFKFSAKKGKYYLVDIIFEKKASINLYPTMISKIAKNKIMKVYYEENIDGSMGIALKDKLKENGMPWCTIEQIYSTANKIQRIADMADTIKNFMVFPSQNFANTKTQMGYAVYQLLQYNGDKSEHDDFADSLAMFAEKFIIYPNKRNTITTMARLPI